MNHKNHFVVLSLGSNIGDKTQNIKDAYQKMESMGQISQRSSYYESSPVEYLAQDHFINTCCGFYTSSQPLELLTAYQNIEKKMEKNCGFIKTIYKGPRVIDIDILFYDNLIFQHSKLQIPHLAWHRRMFVLVPLLEIFPNFSTPTGKLLKLYLKEKSHLFEKQKVKKISPI